MEKNTTAQKQNKSRSGWRNEEEGGPDTWLRCSASAPAPRKSGGPQAPFSCARRGEAIATRPGVLEPGLYVVPSKQGTPLP